MFAHRYSYSIDEFYALTLRQIFNLKLVIENRRIEEFETQAALHDKKIRASAKPLKITKAEREDYNDQAQALLARMNREHGKRSITTD